MKNFFTLLERLSDLTNVGARYLIICIMSTMLFSTTLQVVCRYVFSSALSWPEEVNVFFMAWITFVGSSIGLKQSEHINVDLIINKISSPVLSWFVKFVGHLLMFYIVFLIVRYGTVVAMMNIAVVSEAIEIPLAVPRFSLAVGGVMMIIQLLYIISKDLALCPWLNRNVKQEGAS